MYSEFADTGVYPASLIPSGFPPMDPGAMNEYPVTGAPPCAHGYENIPGLEACQNPSISTGVDTVEICPQTGLPHSVRRSGPTPPM